jgi:hypothetical protein
MTLPSKADFFEIATGCVALGGCVPFVFNKRFFNKGHEPSLLNSEIAAIAKSASTG